jgi:flavin reductase (DIM6/NTAB) family NADH-FMN oxidoreductase RutF
MISNYELLVSGIP